MITNTFRRLCPIIVLSFFLAMTGCKGTETREKVDGTVKTLAGKKSVDQMKEAEKGVKGIEDLRDERLKKADEKEEGQK